MAEFRALKPYFYESDKIRVLTRDEREILEFCIIGRHATNDTNIGIYKIGRATIAFMKKIPLESVQECLGYTEEEFNLSLDRPMDQKLTEKEMLKCKGSFNTDLMKSTYISYNPKTHTIIVKKFFRHNASDYLTTPESIADGIKKDMKNSFDKHPEYWAEFTKINFKELDRAYKDLNPSNKSYSSYKRIFESLFELQELYFPITTEEIKKIIKSKNPEQKTLF